MHFAGIVGYHKMSKMQQSYIDFAEEALSTRIPKNVTTEMRHAYFNLHRGIYAFRENQLKKASYYFYQAIRPEKPLQTWWRSLLIFKIIKRLIGGISYHLLIKYCLSR